MTYKIYVDRWTSESKFVVEGGHIIAASYDYMHNRWEVLIEVNAGEHDAKLLEPHDTEYPESER